MTHGQTIYYKEGHITFLGGAKAKDNSKKHKGIFLEELELHMKILNKNDKIQLIPKELVTTS